MWHRRLTKIKTAWDPKNLLRHNKNITPTSGPARQDFAIR
jgi:hypothetical protein